MTLAVDSSVLLAIFRAENSADRWADLLACWDRLVICEIVVAETSPKFRNETSFREALDHWDIEFEPTRMPAALRAGNIYASYRRSGGPRKHLVPDFLIGAHALEQADALAAADRGYLRRYFQDLKLVGI